MTHLEQLLNDLKHYLVTKGKECTQYAKDTNRYYEPSEWMDEFLDNKIDAKILEIHGLINADVRKLVILEDDFESIKNLVNIEETDCQPKDHRYDTIFNVVENSLDDIIGHLNQGGNV